MEDITNAAKSRAGRGDRLPAGTSFESERKRSKNALVKQISSQDGRNVRMIAAAVEQPEEERILRVAAYCRVSTDDIFNGRFRTAVYDQPACRRVRCQFCRSLRNGK